jgi:hypothetical protein
MIENPDVESTANAVRVQLNLILQDPSFRSSKRSVQFLKYVVEKTLNGQAEQIKERTIGVDVFGRSPSYDTNEDHVVRTAAVELRKRLTIYYSDEKHRTELRMSLVPGSYIPQFTPPAQNSEVVATGSHNDPAQLAEPRMVAPTLLESHPGIEAVTPETPRKHKSFLCNLCSGGLGTSLRHTWISLAQPHECTKPFLETGHGHPGFCLTRSGGRSEWSPHVVGANRRSGILNPCGSKNSFTDCSLW